ncbi:Ectonucleotide pyrophosphatase/phosphodiesterase member 6 [Chamberlinius hualienensis]
MSSTILIVFLCFAIATAVVMGQLQQIAPGNSATGPKLVVLLFSGFRWDFLNYTSSGFKLMQDEGVKAHSMTPVFPSLSYPNAYSLMTGLTSENHGITGDYMYDRKSEEYFLGYPPDYNTQNPQWWDNAEPFWVRASREGHKVEMHWWPGCHVPIFQTRPDVCVPYRNSGAKLPQLAFKLSAILNSLQSGVANVAFVYVDDLLQIARNFGPTSPEAISTIQTIDYTLRLFQDELKVRGLQNEVNVMVTSDHGMARIGLGTSDQRVINLQNIFQDNRDIEKIIDIGPVVGVIPTGGKDYVFNYQYYDKTNPVGLKIYRSYEIPDHWGYRKGEYVTPIVAVAEPGYILVWGGDRSKLISAKSPYWQAVNGYDPYEFHDMRGIFLARGPDFRQNFKTGGIQITDVYNLMCAVTGIIPHKNQGSWYSVRDMLTQLPVSEALYGAASKSTQATNYVIITLINLLIFTYYILT